MSVFVKPFGWKLAAWKFEFTKSMTIWQLLQHVHKHVGLGIGEHSTFISNSTRTQSEHYFISSTSVSNINMTVVGLWDGNEKKPYSNTSLPFSHYVQEGHLYNVARLTMHQLWHSNLHKQDNTISDLTKKGLKVTKLNDLQTNDLRANNLQTNDLRANDLRANNLEPLQAEDLQAENLRANQWETLQTNNLQTNEMLKTNDLRAGDLETLKPLETNKLNAADKGDDGVASRHVWGRLAAWNFLGLQKNRKNRVVWNWKTTSGMDRLFQVQRSKSMAKFAVRPVVRCLHCVVK